MRKHRLLAALVALSQSKLLICLHRVDVSRDDIHSTRIISVLFLILLISKYRQRVLYLPLLPYLYWRGYPCSTELEGTDFAFLQDEKRSGATVLRIEVRYS